jgi:hypothetical protein
LRLAIIAEGVVLDAVPSDLAALGANCSGTPTAISASPK